MHVLCYLRAVREEFSLFIGLVFLQIVFGIEGEKILRWSIKILYAECMGKFENNISKKLHNKTLITENLSPNDICPIM